MSVDKELAYQKKEKLKEYLRELGSLAVAFSGGVDSTFLVAVAHEVLGDNMMAVTARSTTFATREMTEADELSKELGIRHIFVDSNEQKLEGFRDNPPNRCYICKKGIFSGLKEVAASHGCEWVAEGSNMDDMGDYRPGMQAISELDIKSPLRHAELYKEEIRFLSQEMNLPTWDKPSYACLASRFPYGEEITEEKLGMVEKAENLLMELGFKQIRVRIHGKMARIEPLPQDFEKLIDSATCEKVVSELESYGFTYVSMDLKGYRTGSMNEVLEENK